MKYDAICNFCEVEVFYSPMKEPDACTPDYESKREEWLNSFRWQKGVVIRKKYDHCNYTYHVEVSFNFDLTCEAASEIEKHGCYYVNEQKYREGVDFAIIECEQSDDLLFVKDAGSDKRTEFLANVSLLEKRFAYLWKPLYHTEKDAELLYRAYGEDGETIAKIQKATYLLMDAMGEMRCLAQNIKKNAFS